MVDPPLDSGALLQRKGIPSRFVDAIIVSHCHAGKWFLLTPDSWLLYLRYSIVFICFLIFLGFARPRRWSISKATRWIKIRVHYDSDNYGKQSWNKDKNKVETRTKTNKHTKFHFVSFFFFFTNVRIPLWENMLRCLGRTKPLWGDCLCFVQQC